MLQRFSCNFLKISFRHNNASYWQAIVGQKIEFSELQNIVKKYLIITNYGGLSHDIVQASKYFDVI